MPVLVDIQKQMGDFRLEVSFASKGGTLGILGASGTGKSVTLQCIAGILKPDAGRIELNGRVLFDSGKRVCVPPQKRGIGYLFQQYALFPNMTVAQNICAGVRRGTREEKREKVEQALRAFRLEDAAKQYPATLSGGQQQRTALARILIGEPEVILLDEPFSAMDRHLREQLMWELSRTIRSFRGDVLMVSHERDEIVRFCDRAVVIDAGRSEPVQQVDALLRKPGTVADAKLAGHFNIADAERTADGKIRVPGWGAEWTPADDPGPFDAICLPEDAVVLSGEKTDESIPCVISGSMRGEDGSKTLLHPVSGDPDAYLLCRVSSDTETGETVWVSVRKDRILFLCKNAI